MRILRRNALPFLAPALCFAAAVTLVASASDGFAQVQTSGLRGTVIADDGMTIEMAEVILVHEPTGSKKSTYTNASGSYVFNNLRVGGPYTLTILFDGYEPQGRAEIYLTAGKQLTVPVTMKMAGEEVINISGTSTSKNPSGKTTYGTRELEDLPSIGRDPKDVARLNPETYTEGRNATVSIGGANSRFNSVTIDGIRQDDDFGLNAGGYPTQRSPISLAAIEEISVETTPFDVRYGNFIGGNINIVTKSGTNEFKGSLLTTFANQALTGKKSHDDRLKVDFREFRYGGTLGGPIIKDKLHFFVNIEGLDATTPSSVGPMGSGAAFEVSKVTLEDVARAQQIARDVYRFDAGDPSRSLDESDLKLLGKLDWTISPKHRLSGKYQRTGGNSIRETTPRDDLLPLTSNWYNRDERFHAFSLRLLSDWVQGLSTELEVSGKLTDGLQNPLNGRDFMQADITTANGGHIVLGPDIFRHRNELSNDLLHLKGQGDYLLGSHLVTAGWEYDHLSVFNWFVARSNGDARYGSLDDFANMKPSQVRYANAITGDARDAATEWSYGVHALFLQDQYELTEKFSIQGGVRGELYQSAAQVPFNQMFFDRYGFDNTANLDGRSVIMPRAGMSFRPIDGLNLRAGAGLYSGGTPNVWVSNNYTNDGITVDEYSSNKANEIGAFNGRDIPNALKDNLEAGGGNVDALDPNFKVPSTWKASTGADYARGETDFRVNYTYGKARHALRWRELRRNFGGLPANQPVGTLPDGRPFYDQDPSDGERFNPDRGYDFLLTNTKKGYSHTASVSVNQGLPFGFQIFGAYAFQHVKDVNAGTSARAISNYALSPVFDPEAAELGTSIYQRTHRIIGALQFSKPLLFGLQTTLGVFGETRSGQPYSYTFGGKEADLARLFGEEGDVAISQRQRFYVPKGDGSDVILQGIDEEEFNRFIKKSGLEKYRGKVAPKNGFEGPWFNKLDLRFAQDLPNPISGNRARLLVDFENFGNLLNSNWGRYEQPPLMAQVVDVGLDPATGKYIYSNLRTANPARVDVLESVWRLQFTLMYEF